MTLSMTTHRRASAWILIGCGVWLVGLGVYFIALRPPLLPEDPRFMGTTLDELRAQVPGLERWLDRVFTVMGGFMAGAGVLTIVVATEAEQRRSSAASWAIAVAGALTVVLMSAVNFSLESAFQWVLLVPALLWLLSVVLRAAGR